MRSWWQVSAHSGYVTKPARHRKRCRSRAADVCCGRAGAVDVPGRGLQRCPDSCDRCHGREPTDCLWLGWRTDSFISARLLALAFAKTFAFPSHVSNRGPLRLARAATIQGFLWGTGAAWLIPATASPEQAIIGLTIAAMGAGGAMVLATIPAGSVGFTVGCVLPLWQSDTS